MSLHAVYTARMADESILREMKLASKTRKIKRQRLLIRLLIGKLRMIEAERDRAQNLNQFLRDAARRHLDSCPKKGTGILLEAQ